MTPAARVQAAIDILDEWRAGETGLDRIMAGWGRRNRYAGSGDRRAIADLVHDGMRRLRSAGWCGGAGDQPTGRQLLIGLAVMDGQDPDATFTGERHAPASLTAEERAGIGDLADAPRAVRFDYPDWLAADFDGLDDAVLAAMQARAPLDLRVNLLKADRGSAQAALAEDGIETEAVALSDTALRVTEGQRRVQASRAYRAGLVEVQDAASQAVADMASARPGETVLDLCAGGGGKTLALAARMGNQGRLIAHDIAPARMADLPERARRAGAVVELREPNALRDLAGACDLVLVDAPCSGSGTWRRNPDAKWRLTPDGLARLGEAQAGLLAQAADLAGPAGRIVYATCSVLEVENAARISAFLGSRSGWTLAGEQRFTHAEGADGMYCAILTRV